MNIISDTKAIEQNGRKALSQTSILLVLLVSVSASNTIVVKINRCCSRWSNMLMRKLKFTIRFLIIVMPMATRLIIIDGCGARMTAELMHMMILTARTTSISSQSMPLWLR